MTTIKSQRTRNLSQVFTSLINIDKRQKFIISICLLAVCLLVGEFVFVNTALVVAIIFGILTDVFFLVSMISSGEKDLPPQAYILPFVCSFAFSLFYYLAPSRMLTRIVMTTVYATSLYALFLSENIFTVAANRTIALLSGARIVSFILTIISYFFLTNIIYSFRIGLIPTIALLFITSLIFMIHSFWTYSLERSLKQNLLWVIVLSLGLCQLGFILWFWPTSPTIVALFLSGILYIVTGLSHAWLEKRLFKGVFNEYGWVLLAVFLILIFLTNWQGS